MPFEVNAAEDATIASTQDATSGNIDVGPS